MKNVLNILSFKMTVKIRFQTLKAAGDRFTCEQDLLFDLKFSSGHSSPDRHSAFDYAQ